MPRALMQFVRLIDLMNKGVGRVAMYGIFAMMAVLLYSSISKSFFNPSLWTLEVAQFLMVAYFILGGPYSIQLGSNVRMDLFYGSWSVRTKAMVDSVSVLCLLFYLGILFQGAMVSMAYSLGYFGTEPYAFYWDLLTAFVTGGPDAAGEMLGYLERSSTAWRPFLWPVKLVLIAGVFLMLLQVLAELIRDIDHLISGKEDT
ncbi:MAG: TRAP transporter small permease subunit [Alphaproteobacteria bacterium]|nr:TRAP transporter small permease subunit [Alphaproteobacteria bacterium]MBO6864054.1 TRAP transporter small permease subunit [Alphaproteobacteria bacterium]MEC9266443.1 TRAP transporter small permease subunit [Pseudomonadota bacterium]